MNKHSKIIVRWYRAYTKGTRETFECCAEEYEAALEELIELGENLHNAALSIERMNMAFDVESQRAEVPKRKTK